MQSGHEERDDLPHEPLGPPVNRPKPAPAEKWHKSKDSPGFEELGGKLRTPDLTPPKGA